MEQYREKLQAVHEELEPFEKDISETKARMDVATAERNLLVEKVSRCHKVVVASRATLMSGILSSGVGSFRRHRWACLDALSFGDNNRRSGGPSL